MLLAPLKSTRNSETLNNSLSKLNKNYRTPDLELEVGQTWPPNLRALNILEVKLGKTWYKYDSGIETEICPLNQIGQV